MDYVKLKYFRAVAQTEHMSRAAEKLHITQPALSKAISQLEDELGGALFYRVGRQIRLSEKGTVFLRYAEAALNSLEKGMQFMRDAGDPAFEKIKFQTNVTGDRYLVDLVRGFSALHPHTRFEIIKNYTKSKFQNDCDLYVHAENIIIPKCESMPVFHEEVALGVRKDHPLARHRAIRLGQAENESFITLMDTTSWRAETEAFCLEAGFRPNVFYECDGCEMVAKLIAASMGVGFLPTKSWGAFPDEVRLLRITDVSCERKYNLSWHAGREHGYLVSEFRDYVVDFFAALGD